MVKIFCDRCGAPVLKTRNFWEKAQTMNNGDYVPELYIIKDGKDEEKDYDQIVLCDNCQKELEQLTMTFMSAK